MNHTEFFKVIKTGEISPVYFFTGEERYVLRSALKQLENALVQPELADVDVTRLPSTATGQEICVACETVPFLSPKRLVVLDDTAFLAKSGGRLDGEELFIQYLNDPSQLTVLVVVSPQPDKRRKAYKALAAHTVVEFNDLDQPELQRWIEKTLRGYNIGIEPSALRFLIEYADPRPDSLICELEKLACYKKEGTVTKEDILAIITPCNDYNIFRMIDAINARDKNTALTILSGMLASREDPIFILAAISKQYRQLLRIKLLLEEKTPKDRILSLLGIVNFVYTRSEATCRKISTSRLKTAVDLCYKTDEGLKTGGAFDVAALHALVLQLSIC